MPWRRHGITLGICILGIGVCGFLWNGYFGVMLTLVAESAPYLLIGFALAGVLKAIVPEDKVYKHLGENRLKSVTLASLFGIPLPLCSCSVLPVATSLRRSGASKGATTSFLISTPETGLDSIGITYALLDPIMTVARPLGAFATAVFTGSVVNFVVRRGWDGDTEAPADEPADLAHDHGHDHSAVYTPGGVGKRSFKEVARDSASYAFGPLLDDLTVWLIIGLLVSGLIAILVPDDFFGSVIPAGFVSSVLMLLIGTPMYICAAAATPVAATLIAKGLDPGAALVLLLVGPATNATTIAIIARLLGRRVLVLHLIGVTGSALLLGLLINAVYSYFAVDLGAIVARVVESGLSPLNIAATVLFVYLLVFSTVRMRIGSIRGPARAGVLPRRWASIRCLPPSASPRSSLSSRCTPPPRSRWSVRAKLPGWCASGGSCALLRRPVCTPTCRCRSTASCGCAPTKCAASTRASCAPPIASTSISNAPTART